MGIKDDILIAGSLLLREKGVTALTQPQIAQAANIKQSHLTYYFPKRSGLLFSIAEFTLNGLMEDIALRLQQKPQGKTLAEAIAQTMIDGFPPRVFIGLVVAADSDPDIRELLRKLVRHVRTSLRHLMERAGLVADDDTTLLFHATILGLAVLHQARLDEESADEVRRGIEVLVRDLSPKPKKRVSS